MRSILDKVDSHVWDDYSFEDRNYLLERNDMWTVDAYEYLAHRVTRCRSCHSTSKLKPSRKESLSSFHRTFNALLCVNHFFLTDSAYSMQRKRKHGTMKDVSVRSYTEKYAVHAFKTVWISLFLTSIAMQGDDELFRRKFTKDL